MVDLSPEAPLLPPPPLPPKPPHAPQGHSNRRPPKSRIVATSGYDNHTTFRQRATSQDSRTAPKTARGVANGNAGGFRGRLNSDGSGKSSGGSATRGAPSTIIDKRECSHSPPNTPPPPYTEFDSNFRRKAPPTPNGFPFSLSQQADSSPSAYSSTHMQRTRSHGQVPYRRVTISRVGTTPGGVGGGSQGEIAPQIVNNGPPAAVNHPTELVGGGTLV